MAQMIWKVIKICKALGKLERAKENRRRINKGLEPIYPCKEECQMFWYETVPQTFIEAFCCCFIYKPSLPFSKPRWSDSWFWRIFIPGTFEHQCVRSVINFVFGAGLALLIWYFLAGPILMPLKDAFLISMPFALILPVGMALSAGIRCMVFLVIPGIFSNNGRAALLALVFLQIINGPARNITNNVKVVSESFMCAKQAVAKFAKAMMNDMASPLAAIRDTIKDLFAKIKAFTDKITAAFRAIYDVIKEIVATLVNIGEYLVNIAENCNHKMGAPYKRCMDMTKEAIDDCRQKLGVVKGICDVVKIMHPLCAVARVGELLCTITAFVKENIYNVIKNKLTEFSKKVHTFFYLKVHFTHSHSYSMNQSRTLTEVKDLVMAEIRERIDSYIPVLDFCDLFLYSFVFLIFWKAFRYKQRYLTQDRFDNYYITTYVRDIDSRRADMGKPTILPLQKAEKFRYVAPLSWRMIASERINFFLGMILLTSAITQACLFMLVDYGLFFILDTVRRIVTDIKLDLDLPGKLHAKVTGDGLSAKMFRTMIDSFDRMSKTGPPLDTKECLPRPHKPDLEGYKLIFINLFLCFICLLCEVYGMRVRRAVCASFYPQRERERAVALYNEIIRRRGNILKFLRRTLRRKGMDGKEKTRNILERLAYHCPLLGKIAGLFGFNRKYCMACGDPGPQEDFENYRHCSTPDCKGVYCKDCFVDINNMCNICLKPIDYGDMSDMSDERDSSEEEEERMEERKVKKEERKIKREERKVKRVERKENREEREEQMLERKEQMRKRKAQFQQRKAQFQETRKKKKVIKVKRRPKTYHVKKMTMIYEGLDPDAVSFSDEGLVPEELEEESVEELLEEEPSIEELEEGLEVEFEEEPEKELEEEQEPEIPEDVETEEESELTEEEPELTEEEEVYDMDYQYKSEPEDSDLEPEIVKPRKPFKDVEKQKVKDKVSVDIFEGIKKRKKREIEEV